MRPDYTFLINIFMPTAGTASVTRVRSDSASNAAEAALARPEWSSHLATTKLIIVATNLDTNIADVFTSEPVRPSKPYRLKQGL